MEKKFPYELYSLALAKYFWKKNLLMCSEIPGFVHGGDNKSDGNKKWKMLKKA